MKRYLALLLLVSTQLLTAWAHAATYFTSPTGSDANPGTLSAPFRTITAGVGVLHAGDTLYVRAGIYAESFNGAIPPGASWAAPVTVSAYPGETPVIRPAAGPASVFLFLGPERYIVIVGFVIDASNIAVDAVKFTTGPSGAASHIRLQSCVIEYPHEQGVLATDGANYNEILGCTIHDCAMDSAVHTLPRNEYHGVYLSTDHNLVQGCSIYNNPGYGVQVYDALGTAAHDNVVCANNLHDNGLSGISGGGFVLSSGANNAGYNNICYRNLYGICVDYLAHGTLIANNTAYGNIEYGIYVGPGSSNAQIENNIAFNDSWIPDIYDDGSTKTTFTANLSGQDPALANATGGNFQLTSASTAAIGKGVTVPLVTTDIMGIARPQGAAYDIGAYEYVSGAAGPSPGPAVAIISPNGTISGSADTRLTVIGSGFVAGAPVQWNGSPLATTYLSPTTLTATIPASFLVTPGAFTITVLNRSIGPPLSNTATFTVMGAPMLTSLSPSAVTVGNGTIPVTLTGSGFTATAKAYVNGAAIGTTYVSPNQLTATLPASRAGVAGVSTITVSDNTTGGVPSNGLSFAVNNPAPTLAGIAPTSVAAGSAGATLTIAGSLFLPTSQVQINGVSLPTTFVHSDHLTAFIPAGSLAIAGALPISVLTPGPGGGVSGSKSFTVTKVVPTLTNLSPNSALAGSAAISINLGGSNFITGAQAQWNGGALATTYVSSSQLIATAPAGDLAAAGTFGITVVNPGAGNPMSGAVTFTVKSPLTLTAVSPPAVTVGNASAPITVSGTGFTTATKVYLNGAAIPTTYNSATQLTATVPSSKVAAAGIFPIAVGTSAVVGLMSNAVSFAINNPAPTLAGVAPRSAPTGGAAMTLTLSGPAFVRSSTVLFNGSVLPTIYVHSDQLTAVIPAAYLSTPGTFPITVVTPGPGGGSSAPVTFTIK